MCLSFDILSSGANGFVIRGQQAGRSIFIVAATSQQGAKFYVSKD